MHKKLPVFPPPPTVPASRCFPSCDTSASETRQRSWFAFVSRCKEKLGRNKFSYTSEMLNNITIPYKICRLFNGALTKEHKFPLGINKTRKLHIEQRGRVLSIPASY